MVSILTKRLESIFTDDVNHCMFTGSCDVERHHIFHHTHNERMLSEEYRFIAPLRRDLHQNGKLDIYLKQQCQRYYEEHYGTREEFRQDFHKNYL